MERGGEIDREDADLLRRAVRAVATVASGPDPYMAGHAARVADHADRLAGDLGLPARIRLVLEIAAVFHDIGTLATPPYILKKPSVLAENEMEEVRFHPVKGAQVFADDPRLEAVAEVIRHHHERFDGTGYPDGLRGEAIPLLSRIILVAETYEAMTHHRPYRRALSHGEAVARLRESAGTQLDPALVDRFIAGLDGQASS
jgi:HD-GYP domain-containing protein (c-di-GMP phosphodiesterase class II)